MLHAVRYIAITAGLLFSLGSGLHAQKKLQFKGGNGGGKLFIIGGGERPDSLMRAMLYTARLRPRDYIVVLPMASEIPDTGFKYLKSQLSHLTTAEILNFNFNAPGNPTKARIDSLANARLIYILGGDQNRFMQAVLNKPIYKAIHEAHRRGATVAGTSAGAAVMSKYMITGTQKKDSVYKETFDKLWTDNIQFAEGLGLLQHTIVDQHFIKRSRYNRLISALAAKGDDYDYLGIDEGTAVVVQNGAATVRGGSQVVRVRTALPVRATANGRLSFKKITMQIMCAGEKFNIKR